jgi:UV DNA damage endonuclease
MIRFGLCCIFREEPVKFRHTTAKHISSLKSRQAQLEKLSVLCMENSEQLLNAVKTVKRLGIGAFRVLSQMFPVYTHPESGYQLDDLPDAPMIRNTLNEVRKYSKDNNIRLSFHPDQFVILASPREEVLHNSLRELQYQCMVADMTGAVDVNIHMGGVYGDKAETIRRFSERFPVFPEDVKKYLTLENDDISYHVKDLYPVCMDLGIPLTYDVHHHRCNPDGLSIEDASRLCVETWEQAGREPHFHISSPKDGWKGNNHKPHADYINIKDFPSCWKHFDLTLDVEAKAKELAVVKLMKELELSQ